MYRTMNLKGFLLILGILLAIFLILHSVLKGAVNDRAEKENALRVRLTQLEAENKDLNNQLNMVGTDE